MHYFMLTQDQTNKNKTKQKPKKKKEKKKEREWTGETAEAQTCKLICDLLYA